MVWWNLAFFVVTFVGSMVLNRMRMSNMSSPNSKEKNKPKAASLSDFNFPTVSAGRPIPVLFGTKWIDAPNVTWYGDLQTEEIKEAYQESSGGGGKK